MANGSLKSLNTLTVAIFMVLWGTGHSLSCSEDANAVAVDVEKMAGVWYEVARAPESDVPACLKVIAPTSVENDNYTLELDYVNNVSKGWKRVQENLTFPWNNYTQGGLFNLSYSDGSTTVDVNFKYMGTYNNFSLVCGYSGIASGVSMLRLLSRNKTVDSSLISTFEKLLAAEGIDSSQMTWVEQGGRCNSAVYLSSSAIAVLFAVLMAFMPKIRH